MDASWSKWEQFKGDADATLFADPTDNARPERLRWLVASLALQALVVGFLVLHSVTSESELPAPRVVETFLTVAPMATAPPPPPPPSRHGTIVSGVHGPSARSLGAAGAFGTDHPRRHAARDRY